MAGQKKAVCLLEQLEKELEGEEEKKEAEGTPPLPDLHETVGGGEEVGEEACLNEQEEEEESHEMMEAKLLHEQDSALQQVSLSVLSGIIGKE